MDVDRARKSPEVSTCVRKKPLAGILSMVLDRLVGFYIVDENGNEIEIEDDFWHWNIRK